MRSCDLFKHNDTHMYLLYGVVDVVVDALLRVDAQRLLRIIPIVPEEQMLEGVGVLLLKRHHHLITETKQHQLTHTHTQVETHQLRQISTVCTSRYYTD